VQLLVILAEFQDRQYEKSLFCNQHIAPFNSLHRNKK